MINNCMNSNSLGFQGSPVFSLNNQSPYLSPLINSHHRKSSFDQNQLVNFELGQAENDEQFFENIQHQQQISSNSVLALIPEQSKMSLQRDLPPPLQENSEPEISENQAQEEKVQLNIADQLTRIQMLILFLIQNSSMPQDSLKEESKIYTNGSKQMSQIFNILVKKFKKLKKTKEEMTKYCMRKAFKFISDQHRNQKYKEEYASKDLDACLKQYFTSAGNQNNFSIPFKKNSTEKTMNASFLKKIFNLKGFTIDYKLFLRQFAVVIQDDNTKKVNYLAQMIQDYLNSNSVKKVQTIKRLPWTKQILKKTENLGHALLVHCDDPEIQCQMTKKQKLSRKQR